MRSSRRPARPVLVAPQQLETRLALAGDVKASLQNGLLKLSGDGADNAVVIERQVAGFGGQGLRVRSADGSTGIVFNGQRSNDLVFAGVARLEVKMGGGDDSIRVGSVLPVDLTAALFDLGDGDDALNLVHLGVTGSMSVRTGSGSDTVDTGILRVSGSSTVDTGSGNDRVSFAPDVILQGLLTITLGSGDDELVAQGPQAAHEKNFTIRLVEGDDAPSPNEQRKEVEVTFRDVVVKAGDGSDRVSFIGPIDILGSMTVDMGAGDGEQLRIVAGLVETLTEFGPAHDRQFTFIDDFFAPLIRNGLSISKGRGSAEVDVIGGAFSLVRAFIKDGTTGFVDEIDVAPLAGGQRRPETVLVGNAVSINLEKAGSSQLVIERMTALGNVTVKTGKAADQITVRSAAFAGKALITASRGDNVVSLEDVRGGGLEVSADSGIDTVGVKNVVTGGNVSIKTANGDDTVDVTDVDAGGKLSIDSGRNDDLVRTESVGATESVFVNLGSGDDRFEFKDLDVGDDAIIDGGSGLDSIRTIGLIPVLLPGVVNFE